MKKILLGILVTILTISSLVGCGGTEYCSVSGCPKESASGCDYCYGHKCTNTSCKNVIAYSGCYYCQKCLDRAMNK